MKTISLNGIEKNMSIVSSEEGNVVLYNEYL